MSKNILLSLPEELHKNASKVAKDMGYKNIQELCREALRAYMASQSGILAQAREKLEKEAKKLLK